MMNILYVYKNLMHIKASNLTQQNLAATFLFNEYKENWIQESLNTDTSFTQEYSSNVFGIL